MKLFNSGIAGVSAALFVGILSACMQLGANEDELQPESLAGNSPFVQCNTPRPEICYEVYQPVCATRDNGIRCVTTPCPSNEMATYSNDCKACSDPSVLGFVRGGACKGAELSVDLLRGPGT
ncbi:MAG: hypothetical protein ACPGVP_04285 [Thiolinea sp.]